MKFRLGLAFLTASIAATLASCAQQLSRPAPPPTLPPTHIAPAPKPEIAPAEPIGEMQVALILASRGPYAGPAELVRDGFLAALYAQTGTKPTVRIYDTGGSADAVRQAVRRAVNEGARFIVGPLQKDMVAALASQGTPPVPMLALNYLEPNQSAPGDFYELGLAPEDEARAAAEQAIAAGFHRAAALTPTGDWGERVLAAFSKRLSELGGELASAALWQRRRHHLADPRADGHSGKRGAQDRAGVGDRQGRV
jgi:outer membrane PBP1 activator LpoA protein